MELHAELLAAGLAVGSEDVRFVKVLVAGDVGIKTPENYYSTVFCDTLSAIDIQRQFI